MHALNGRCLVSSNRLTVWLSAHKTTFQTCLFPEAGCSIWSLADAAHKLLQHHLALWHNNPSRMRIKIKGNSHSLSPPYSVNKLSVSDFSLSFTALAVLRNAEVPCFMHAVLLWGCWLNSSKVHKETFHSYSQRQLILTSVCLASSKMKSHPVPKSWEMLCT